MLNGLLRLPAIPFEVAERALADLAALAELARSVPERQRAVTDRADALLDRADALLVRSEELLEVGRAAVAKADQVIAVGEENVAVGRRLVQIGDDNVGLSRDTGVELGALNTHAAALLEIAQRVERELPDLAQGFEAMQDLRESAGALSDAAPPITAAAERVERIAGRIPGVRS